AHIRRAVQHLPLEIAEIDDIEIDQADAADACRREVQAQRRAEAAGADEENAGRLEAFLPFQGDLGHDEMPAVTSDFLRGQGDALGARAEEIKGGGHGDPFLSLRKRSTQLGFSCLAYSAHSPSTL